MAVYNAESWLRQAVDSVLAQTFPDWELLAVDDASTDHSRSILNEYAQRDRRIRVFHKEKNEGLAAARNLALAEVKGDYVCILDADDWFSCDALKKGVEGFAQPDVDCVVFRLVEHEDGQQFVRHEPLPLTAVVSGEKAFRLSLDWSLHGLFLIRTEIHQRYPYDTSLRLYSDDNTVHLHYLRSRKVAFCSGEYHYRKHPLSATSSISPLRFQHLQANLQLRNILREEGAERSVQEAYETVRWYNYRALLRLYHLHRNDFTVEERRDIHSLLGDVYATFGRLLPFRLYEWRDRLALLLRKGKT